MQKKNILIITQWGFEEGLIQSYTLPYLKIIHSVIPDAKIFLYTQEKKGLQRDKAKLEKIRNELRKDNIFLLPRKYYKAGGVKYFVSAARLLGSIWFCLKNNIKFIHSFCTPAGSDAYLLSRFLTSKLVIDSYEPHSEYMKDAGIWSERSFAYSFLSVTEKKQAMRADYLIATTSTMQAYTEKRFNIHLKNVFIKPACVDLAKFDYNKNEADRIRKELNLQNKIVGVYAGKFGDFYLREESFELFKAAFKFFNENLHILLLSDLKKEELTAFCEDYDLNVQDFTLISSSYREMPFYLSAADFAFSLYRPAPSKKYCTPIKNGEYWAIGLPVIITKDISDDSDAIEKSDVGYVLQNLSKEEYQNAIRKIDSLLLGNREVLREKIRQLAVEKRSFGIAEKIYKKIYSN